MEFQVLGESSSQISIANVCNFTPFCNLQENSHLTIANFDKLGTNQILMNFSI